MTLITRRTMVMKSQRDMVRCPSHAYNHALRVMRHARVCCMRTPLALHDMRSSHQPVYAECSCHLRARENLGAGPCAVPKPVDIWVVSYVYVCMYVCILQFQLDSQVRTGETSPQLKAFGTSASFSSTLCLDKIPAKCLGAHTSLMSIIRYAQATLGCQCRMCMRPASALKS